ncbi:MAG TPA: GAF domain-containing protein, partial [Spirochaetes bacterium]|nr:GAF domain-containing protein [Spirochaetota bacterium]
MSSIQDDISFDFKGLGQISNLINSTLDIPKLLEIIMDAAKDLLNAEASSLLLIDYKKRVLNFAVVAGDKGELIREIAVPIGVGIAGIVAETGEALIVNDAENDQRVYKAVDQKTNTVTRNLICVPMRVKDKIVGVLEAINSADQSQFNESQLNVLSYLADQAAIALNNGDLFKGLAKARFSLQKRVKELSILFEFNDIVNFAISIQELIPMSVAFIRKTFNTNSALFYLFSPARQELVLNYLQGTQASNSQQHIHLSRDLKTYLARHGKPIQIKTDLPQELSGLSELNLNTPLLIIPLFTEGNLFGLMFLWNKRDSKAFSPFHIRLMGHLASHFSQAYANLKLHESLLVQTEIKQELKVARLIQQKILPSTFNTPDDVEIQGVSIPAEEVGGDFYDFIPIDEYKFALVIADVSGKGIPA